jgi:hypothetical protein
MTIIYQEKLAQAIERREDSNKPTCLIIFIGPIKMRATRKIIAATQD